MILGFLTSDADHVNYCFRSRDQLTVAILLGIFVGCLVLRLFSISLFADGVRTVEYDKAEKRNVQFKVDLNHAPWPELALLPGIGENLAKRIVEFRKANGLYGAVDELHQVNGIGPKKYEAVKKYLTI